MSTKYGFKDILVGEPWPPTPEGAVRRDIAESLRAITDRLVRMDAPQAELEDYAARLRSLRDDIAPWPRRPQGALLQRLMDGQGSHQDVLDLMDHEIMTGRASVLAPPLDLWLDGDVVRGRAELGLAWQGPPGRVHGGVIALMMDILLAKTQDLVGGIGMTGTLSLRYVAGTPLKTPIDMEARVREVKGRKLIAEARFIVNGETTVTAEGIWICARGEYGPVRTRTSVAPLAEAMPESRQES
ncbi:PaaI family thioesterase [Isoalcanivorax indicus]|uniref:PaaI family thioesterase n=1 Tax=Isoalcanivorax indicus TaxID=2202653 RepID=UPI001B85D771|nr:PaaI family thioesterase [Isoalcanivorax indicus]